MWWWFSCKAKWRVQENGPDRAEDTQEIRALPKSDSRKIRALLLHHHSLVDGIVNQSKGITLVASARRYRHLILYQSQNCVGYTPQS